MIKTFRNIASGLIVFSAGILAAGYIYSIPICNTSAGCTASVLKFSSTYQPTELTSTDFDSAQTTQQTVESESGITLNDIGNALLVGSTYALLLGVLILAFLEILELHYLKKLFALRRS